MHINGQISLCGFLCGIGIPQYFFDISNLIELNSLDFAYFKQFIDTSNFYSWIYFITLSAIILWIIVEAFYHIHNLHESVKVFFISLGLGITFSVGILRLLSNQIESWLDRPFAIYMCIMVTFHFTEYLTTAFTNPANLELDSFLLNHSREYGIAAAFSWLEYGTEIYFVPAIKSCHVLVSIGLAVCVTGEIIRKLAMFTANTNFNHHVQSERAEDHELVTNGIYSWCRHPSYAGWFFWSIGTQIALLNPFSVIAYTLASWRFFQKRIEYEEATLIMFFGDSYLNFQETTKFTGVPFVTGYQLPSGRKQD